MKRFTAILAAVFTLLVFSGCTAQPAVRTAPAEALLPTAEVQPSATALPPATATTAPTATETTPPTPTEEPTQPVTPQPTRVRAGTFAILYYKPLVLNYDAALWQDASLYNFKPRMVNYLLLKSASSCRITPQGPSGFTTSEEGYTKGEKQLGDITYTTLETSQPTAEKMMFYFAEGEITGYDSGIGTPILVVSSSEEAWETCQAAAEEVLATLHSPTGD